MDGMDAVLDEPELEVQGGQEEPGNAVEPVEGAESAGGEAEKVDGRRGSKEFRDALKAWEATPEGAKFAKTARNDRFRVEELAALEPGGITALRERYALIESIGGAEGVTRLQERVAGAEAVDTALASGNPKVFEVLGADFNAGLAKLAPAYLDRVMRDDPEAYASAILPHLMSSLASSPLVGDLNKMVDIFGAQHLDDAGKLKAISGLLGKIGAWYDHNERKAGEAKAAPSDKGRTELDGERAKFSEEQQTAHWNNKISPVVGAYERTKLEEFFKPFDTRLKLDGAARGDLFDTFKQRMTAAAKADAGYMKQMGIYRGQKSPDPAAVANFVKSAINRHAKGVVEAAVKARYGRFLGGSQTKQAAQVSVPGARSAALPGTVAPTIVSIKPAVEDIDYRRTPEADQWKGIYTLNSGKRVQVRKPA